MTLVDTGLVLGVLFVGIKRLYNKLNNALKRTVLISAMWSALARWKNSSVVTEDTYVSWWGLTIL